MVEEADRDGECAVRQELRANAVGRIRGGLHFLVRGLPEGERDDHEDGEHADGENKRRAALAVPSRE